MNLQSISKDIYKTMFLLIFPFLLSTSCSQKDDGEDCGRIETEYVTAVSAPDTAGVNETVNIDVEFSVDNSCGEFNRFIETGSETSRTIEVEAVYKGCACFLAIQPTNVTYEFRPEEAGEYELRFKSSEEEVISVSINVM